MEQIKTQQITARKAADQRRASLLTTLLGEAAMVGKNANRDTTDQEVVAVVKKFIKNIDETIAALSARNQPATEFANERTVLEQFLPQQLSETQIRVLASEQKDMPSFMKFLKDNYAGQYDGKLASTVAKSVYQ